MAEMASHVTHTNNFMGAFVGRNMDALLINMHLTCILNQRIELFLLELIRDERSRNWAYLYSAPSEGSLE